MVVLTLRMLAARVMVVMNILFETKLTVISNFPDMQILCLDGAIYVDVDDVSVPVMS